MAKEVETALEKYPTVAISSLEIKDVENALNLHLDRRDKELEQYLKLIDGASNRSPSTEVSVRWTIDALLLNAHSIAAKRTPVARPIVQRDSSYTHGPVRLKGKLIMLSARTDYGVWYGETEEVALNVVIVKAKNMDSDSGVAQALGYMGCVHRERKSLHKQDCTIYGLVTTGETFRFLKISNDSKWLTYVLDVYSCSLSGPFGLLVNIFCRAAVMSPAHSKESSCQFHQQEASADSAPLETVDKDDKNRGLV
ncbi:hypothetical protein CBS147339_440 [Penicillium roqueforti]|uniref:Genomic scaffold, ProqFM164S02 n=1 Tax=Penicillium roqueforti (strain FM164) TaxID=1365484 RepID=W6QMN5_PENRF|nr:hypothetical protein CBS147339_440 [Penicillium roqueforti]CDM30842.1 unnamed protein product [Penicillium roqueforti FM164]KAI3107534.1 hypothetical protein CBS147338_448 [Penicillium roqueforti]KAI3156639.1 hypothetical protein CBS147325_339 [Penicillium roqueforti]KAI3183446.1 hypothetical protein DTO046C5_461 [Penicillium roqueforti]